jgi:hypothetical protein
MGGEDEWIKSVGGKARGKEAKGDRIGDRIGGRIKLN